MNDVLPAPSDSSPPKPVAVIESDTFCEKCGFNLHTQPVWKDERLDILICRCPECGGHQAAGQQTTVGYSWLSRLALAGALVWMVIFLALVIGTFFGFLGYTVFNYEYLTFNRSEDAQGQALNIGTDANGMRFRIVGSTTQPLGSEPSFIARRFVDWVPVLGVPVPEGWYYRSNKWEWWMGMAFFLLGIWIISAILAAVSWHWRKGLMYLWLLLPLLGTTFFYVVETAQSANRNYLSTNVIPILCLFSALSGMLFMALGLRAGRPLTRLILRAFVPPRARQLFAFLWTCDGLTLKPVTKEEGT